MPPRAAWFRGRDAVEVFLHRGPFAPGLRWRLVQTTAGRPAGVRHLSVGRAGRWAAQRSTSSRSPPTARIAEVIAFLDAAAVRRFGLPDELR